jgi:hypothetical protein
VFRLPLRAQESETARRRAQLLQTGTPPDGPPQGNAEDRHGEKGAAGSRLIDEHRFPLELRGPAGIGRHLLPPFHQIPRRLSALGTGEFKPRYTDEFAKDKKEEAGQGEERTESGRVETPSHSTASRRIVASRVEIAVSYPEN